MRECKRISKYAECVECQAKTTGLVGSTAQRTTSTDELTSSSQASSNTSRASMATSSSVSYSWGRGRGKNPIFHRVLSIIHNITT